MRNKYGIWCMMAVLLIATSLEACSKASAESEGAEAPMETAADGLPHDSVASRSQGFQSRRRAVWVDTIARQLLPKFRHYRYLEHSGTDSLRFRMFSPQPVEAGRIYPLVFFLADESAVGRNDGSEVKNSFGALSWATAEIQKKDPCYVLVPKFTTFYVDDKNNLSAETERAVRMLRTVLNDWQIDNSRIYVAGQGMGGEAAMKLLGKHPDLFAAAMLVECGSDADTYASMVNTPFVFVVSKAGPDSMNDVALFRKTLTSKGVRSVASEWSGQISPALQDTLTMQLLGHGEKHAFIVLNEVTPSDVYDRAWTLTPALEWVMECHTLDF